MSGKSRPMHTILSADAHRAWHALADGNGVSLSGLVEAQGQAIADELAKAEIGGLDATAVFQPWVLAARKVDVERRRR